MFSDSTTLRIFVAVILLASALIGLHYRAADPGGHDDGLLQLAGATSLLQNGSYTIIQRPPFYSAILALLAAAQGIDISETQPLAQELGSIEFHAVAVNLLTPPFLASVLVVNLVLWVLTVIALLATLRLLDIHWHWQTAALLISLIPASWRMAGAVSETMLCAFLLMTGICTLIYALVKARIVIPVLVAGITFAMAGLTRATFQLLPLVICVLLMIFLWREKRRALFAGLLFLLPYILIIGGWSWRNYAQHGFFGVSGVAGVALSTRTADFLERASSRYPEEVAIFRSIRDQLYLDVGENKGDIVYWGARASNWLMENRGMSYIETNRFLLAFNLEAIRAAPLNYLHTVLTSVLNFHYPASGDEWGTALRLLFSLIEFALMAVFTGGSLLWGAAHIFARMGWLTPRWQVRDTVIVVALALFWYTAFVSSAIDVGKPEHRIPIQLVIPLVVVLTAHFLKNAHSSIAPTNDG